MLFRFVLSLLIVLVGGTKAWACSCAPWQGGLVSEFVGTYASFWGVPIQSELKPLSTDRPDLIVSYKVEILEGFGRITKTNVEVRSSIEDGGSCGIQLTMGIPQFLSAYEGKNDQFWIGSCTPHLPYKAIKEYLESDIDAHVPDTNECFDEELKLITENSDCAVWEGVSFDSWVRHGQEDWIGYLRQWRERTKNSITPH